MKSDDVWQEEDIHVVAELSGFIDDGFLLNYGKDHNVLGLETQQPYVQVDHNVFQGRYDLFVGTCLVFEESLGDENGDESEDPPTESAPSPPKLTYYCKTGKILDLKKVFFTNKPGQDTTSSSTANDTYRNFTDTHVEGEITHCQEEISQDTVTSGDTTDDYNVPMDEDRTDLQSNTSKRSKIDDTVDTT